MVRTRGAQRSLTANGIYSLYLVEYELYEVRSVPVLLVSVGFLSLLHAQLEGEAGEGFFRGVTAEPRPLFFGNPASSFHPRFTLWCPLETVFIFHDLILA